MNYNQLKILFDKLFALFLLIVLMPVFLLLGALIKLDSRGPVMHTQLRVGKHQRIFKIYKFRTMIVDNNRSQSQTLPGDTGITAVGKIIRRLKIDESAQLLNVLIGDMSLVGPRPCLPNLVSDMDQESLGRFSVKPGLTGLAQVNGNIYIDWCERWAFDLMYIRNISFVLDLKILVKTIAVILFTENVFVKNRKI